jgi:hypothetical protein
MFYITMIFLLIDNFLIFDKLYENYHACMLALFYHKQEREKVMSVTQPNDHLVLDFGCFLQ